MQNIADQRLLRAVAEELKLPLVQIAGLSELDQANTAQVNDIARMALKLIDGFLLSSRLSSADVLPMEPVSLSAVLADTAHKLEPLAKQNNCDVVVSLDGKYGPVMAHKDSLETALLLLGHSVVSGWTGTGKKRRHQVVLGLHKSAEGLVTGVFDNQPSLSPESLRRAQAYLGTTGQTLPTTASNNGAGIFVADALLRPMSGPLYVSRHKNKKGLAARFQTGGQLRLV